MSSAMEASLGISGHRPRTELDDEDYYPQGGWDTVFLVALLLLGLPANGLMAWLAGSQARQGAGTRLALLMLSLALSDLLFLAAAAFQILEIQHGGHWPLGTAACRFYYFLWGVSYSSGLFLLAALSLDRCLLALCPRWYPGRRPARLPLWVCSGVWVLATLFSVPWLVFPEAAVWWYDLVICLDFWDSEELPLRAFEVLGGFLPFLLLLGSHVLTQAAACRTRCCGRRPPRPPACRGFARVAKTVLSAYVLLRLPYQLAQLLYLAFLCDLYPGYLLWEALVYSDYLVLLSSCLSPFLCVLASADLRALLHALLASFAAALCEEQPGTILPAELQNGAHSSHTPPEARPHGNPPAQPPVNPPAQPPASPTTQAQVNPTTQPLVNPTTQAQVNPMTQAQVTPITQPQVTRTTQAQVNPTTQAQVNPTTQPPVNPMTQAQVNLTTQAQGTPMTQAQVTPVTQVTCTTHAQVNPTTQEQMNPTTQAQPDPAGQSSLSLITQPQLNLQPQGNLQPQPEMSPQTPETLPSQPESDPTVQPSLSPATQPKVQCEVQGPDPAEQPEASPEAQPRAASPAPSPCEETPAAPAPTPEAPKSPAPPAASEGQEPGRAPPEAAPGAEPT
ncbi:probable G-protein coupled receptor 152 [Sorex fumeus]|uniref:probable G-protein coupled receptor 152 n=1 Tax=Sorex fumeus TaxID=62283 RepID=UPI0024AE78C6|nr:probable G-protein coupled receptor 152 [Sorex fumeus]